MRCDRLMLPVVGLAMAAGFAGVTMAEHEATQPLEYRVVELKGKLLREEPPPELRVQLEETIFAGAVLRTGWRSSAELSNDGIRSRFVLGPRTTVRLADDRPGVLVEIQKGRIRALFDSIEGEEKERLVTTPSAILAVRGTSYAVSVNRSGHTTLVVFEGVVEILDAARSTPPIRVEAGNSCTVRLGSPPSPPTPHRMSPGDWDRGRTPQSMSAQSSAPSSAGGATGSSGRGSSGSSGRGRH